MTYLGTYLQSTTLGYMIIHPLFPPRGADDSFIVNSRHASRPPAITVNGTQPRPSPKGPSVVVSRLVKHMVSVAPHALAPKHAREPPSLGHLRLLRPAVAML